MAFENIKKHISSKDKCRMITISLNMVSNLIRHVNIKMQFSVMVMQAYSFK
jgi:hypothetical protein